MREKFEMRGFYTGLTCSIMGYDPEPFHAAPRGSESMVFSLLQFIIWVYKPGLDWDSFLDLGDYIGNVLEKYTEGRDLLYDARYYGDISEIPPDVVSGYDIYRGIINTLTNRGHGDEDITEMTKIDAEITESTKYTHYQYLQMIKERYNERKRKMYIQRSSAPQFQAAPETQGTDQETAE